MKKIVCCLLFVVIGMTSAFPAAKAQFTGTVINLFNDSIEIKKRNKEITLSVMPNTKIYFKGKEVEFNLLEVCQQVKALYIVSGKKKELIRLEILAESYCTR